MHYQCVLEQWRKENLVLTGSLVTDVVSKGPLRLRKASAGWEGGISFTLSQEDTEKGQGVM